MLFDSYPDKKDTDLLLEVVWEETVSLTHWGRDKMAAMIMYKLVFVQFNYIYPLTYFKCHNTYQTSNHVT